MRIDSIKNNWIHHRELFMILIVNINIKKSNVIYLIFIQYNLVSLLLLLLHFLKQVHLCHLWGRYLSLISSLLYQVILYILLILHIISRNEFNIYNSCEEITCLITTLISSIWWCSSMLIHSVILPMTRLKWLLLYLWFAECPLFFLFIFDLLMHHLYQTTCFLGL